MSSFVADLLSDSFVDPPIIKKFYFLVVFGTLAIFASIFVLDSHYSSPVPSVDGYKLTHIEYSAVRYRYDDEYKEIILGSADQKYSLSENVWKGKLDPENIVEELKRSNQADVWLSKTDIKGIKTETIFIDPEWGASYDKS